MSKSVLLDHEKFAKEMEALNSSQERIAELLGISDRHVRILLLFSTELVLYFINPWNIS